MKCFYTFNCDNPNERSDFYYWGNVKIVKVKKEQRWSRKRYDYHRYFTGLVYNNDLGYHRVEYRVDRLLQFKRKYRRISQSKVPYEFINYIKSNQWLLDMADKEVWHQI